MGFAVSADLRVKIKENEIRDQYWDLAGELRKVWDRKITVKTIINVCASKGLQKLGKGIARCRKY